MVFPGLVLLASALALQDPGNEAWDGFAEPFRTVEVAAAEPGLLRDSPLREGAKVTKGQILAQLDIELLDSSLAMAKARREASGRIKAAEAEWMLRKDRLKRFEELHQKGNASTDELSRARADEQIAAGNHLSLKEEQEIAGLECERIQQQIARRQVRSPIDGFLIQLHYEPGEFVSPSAPSVAKVIQINPLRVVLYVPAKSVVKLSPGVKLPVKFPDLPTVPGEVEYIAPVADAQSGTVKVHLTVSNPENTLRSGSRCTVSLPDALKN